MTRLKRLFESLDVWRLPGSRQLERLAWAMFNPPPDGPSRRELERQRLSAEWGLDVRSW